MDKLIILFGGESPERLVSVATAQNIAEALPEASCWFWSPHHSVYEVERSALLEHQNAFKSEFKPQSPKIYSHVMEALDSEKAKQSLFVLGVHGGQGEDGTLQAWLEARKIAFTGPNSQACRLSMDKALAKKIVQEHGGRVALSGDNLDNMLKSHPKLILKPNAEGSSVGMLIVTAENKQAAQLELTTHPERDYLLEAYVQGTELTVGVVDGPAGPRALVPTELRAQEGFADYDGKYLGLGTQEITPAEVSESIAKAAQNMALLAHQALGCEGYSRSDMIVDALGPVYLETNSLPGLTKASLLPQQLAYEGESIRGFLLKQVELARERLARSL